MMRHWKIVGCVTVVLGFLGACAGPSEVKTSDAENIPVAIPPIEVVLDSIGPGDEVEVKVFRHDDLQRRTRVPAGGVIMLPLVGEVSVNGISTEGLRRILTGKYSMFIVKPQVTVDVVLQRSTKIIVLGEVRQPGVFYMSSATSALEAITLAGGFTRDSKMNEVMLLRGMPNAAKYFKLNLDEALVAGAYGENPSLHPGDVLYVPPSTVANVDRFFAHLENALRPVLYLGQSMVLGDQARRILRGEGGGTTTNVIVTKP